MAPDGVAHEIGQAVAYHDDEEQQEDAPGALALLRPGLPKRHPVPLLLSRPRHVLERLTGEQHDLQDLVETQGYDGAFQTLKAAGVPTVPVGTDLTFYLVGIGDQYHSWHIHGGSPVFVNGEPVEGDVVPLGPGTAAIARVRVTNPGIWLIHCHVVIHADLGMVTLILAE